MDTFLDARSLNASKPQVEARETSGELTHAALYGAEWAAIQKRGKPRTENIMQWLLNQRKAHHETIPSVETDGHC